MTSENHIHTNACAHYKKRLCADLMFSCCGATANCHRCHDDMNGTGTCAKKMSPQMVESIVCSKCSLRQPPSNQCIAEECGIQFSKSYCDKCRVWVDFSISHCDKCGICRAADAGSLFHCDECDCCFLVGADGLDASIEKHQRRHRVVVDAVPPQQLDAVVVKASKKRCLESSRFSVRESDCPVCLESIFFSRDVSVFLPCTHILHKQCLMKYCRAKLRDNLQPTCPLCRKQFFTSNY